MHFNFDCRSRLNIIPKSRIIEMLKKQKVILNDRVRLCTRIPE